MGAIQTSIDGLLALLKWPAAVLSVALVPALGMALWSTAVKISANLDTIAPLLLGVAVYFAGWLFLFRRRMGLFATLEHELTHTLFALCTFHQVVGLKTTATQGGQHAKLGAAVGAGAW